MRCLRSPSSEMSCDLDGETVGFGWLPDGLRKLSLCGQHGSVHPWFPLKILPPKLTHFHFCVPCPFEGFRGAFPASLEHLRLVQYHDSKVYIVALPPTLKILELGGTFSLSDDLAKSCPGSTLRFVQCKKTFSHISHEWKYKKSRESR